MCGSKGVYGKSLYLPLNFVVNLKTALKNVFLIKGIKYLLMHVTTWMHFENMLHERSQTEHIL